MLDFLVIRNPSLHNRVILNHQLLQYSRAWKVYGKCDVNIAIVDSRQSSEMIISMVYWDNIVRDSAKVVASLSRVVEGLEAGSNKLWPIV